MRRSLLSSGVVRQRYSGPRQHSDRPRQRAAVDIGSGSTEEGAQNAHDLPPYPPPSRRRPLIPMPIASPPLTAHFAPLATGYDVVLSDVWGVVHNGAVAFA